MTPEALQTSQYVIQRLIAHGISPMYATAVAGHLIEESGGFDPRVIAGERRGDGGTAGYIAQWRGERLANLEAFARSQGRPLDLDTQIDFLVYEGRSGLDAGAARWYKQAVSGQGNLADAVAAFAHFERPQGYTSNNPYGIATFEKRLGHASNVAGLAGHVGAATMGSSARPAGQGLPTPAAGNGVYGLNPFVPASAAPNRASQQNAPMPPLGAFDWTSHRSGGGLREDAIVGLDPRFRSGLEQMITGAPEFIRQGLTVGSGYRSEQRQSELWAEALRKYGSPEAARKWVAPPGNSKHNHGAAADLRWNGQRLDKAPPEVRQWVHQNAARFGMAFPLGNEPWHIEPADARSGGTYTGGGSSNEGSTPNSAPFGVAGQGPSSSGDPYANPAGSPAAPTNTRDVSLYGQSLYKPLEIDYGQYGIETPNLDAPAGIPQPELGFDPYNVNTLS